MAPMAPEALIRRRQVQIHIVMDDNYFLRTAPISCGQLRNKTAAVHIALGFYRISFSPGTCQWQGLFPNSVKYFRSQCCPLSDWTKTSIMPCSLHWGPGLPRPLSASFQFSNKFRQQYGRSKCRFHAPGKVRRISIWAERPRAPCASGRIVRSGKLLLAVCLRKPVCTSWNRTSYAALPPLKAREPKRIISLSKL